MNVPEEWIRRPKTTRERIRAGWTRLSPRGAMTCCGHFRHTSGWEILHCGHPTANWPYYLVAPDGRKYVAPHGHGFRLLADAMQMVEGQDFSRCRRIG